MPAAVASQWRDRQRQVFQSVFQTDIAQPTPQPTSSILFSATGQPFDRPAASLADKQQSTQSSRGYRSRGQHAFQSKTLGPSLHTASPPPLPSAAATISDDQAAYDRAWDIVTAHIALPSSATADDAFGSTPTATVTTTGTLAPELQPQQQQQQMTSRRRRGQDRDATTSVSASTFSSPGSGPGSSEFYEAFSLLVNARALLPHATRTDDVLTWHVRRVHAHFAQHVIPLLAGCVDEAGGGGDGEFGDSGGSDGKEEGQQEDQADAQADRHRRTARQERGKGNYYEKHMVIVMTSIRTLEAALRLYFFGMDQLLSGFARLADVAPEAAREAHLANARFRRDLHALISASVPRGLMRSVKAVLERLASTILGIPSRDEVHLGSEQAARPAAPGPDDLKVQAARERLIELVQQLHNVGLTSERFQVLFAEVMDFLMSEFVVGAYASLWTAPDAPPFSTSMDTSSRSAAQSVASPCIASLNDWVENHFARLSFEVLACIANSPQGPLPVTLADLKTYQSLALGRLAALRIRELFDIVLAWPESRPALEDLRATITTAARRKQLTDSFSRDLQTRLLHPGCSTLEILQTYISIIRTLYALDPSKVLLSRVEPGLRLYLCQREDAVRIFLAGLLASSDEVRAAEKAKEAWKRQADTTSSHATAASTVSRLGPRATNLAQLGLLLNKSVSTQGQSRSSRAAPAPSSDDADLDWSDLSWMPDPIDAGANYKRPRRSEDVVGTLISALGSEDVFIKEFASVVAERLLALVDPAQRFEQELRVLELLKRHFGEASLQACDVMIRDVLDDSRKVNAVISGRGGAATAAARRGGRVSTTKTTTTTTAAGGEEDGMEYRARILSRLFWPGLEREHFLLPAVVVEQQQKYEAGYEGLKSRRKLTWLNQMGQARVEIELQDRTVTVDCSPVEATIVYAFQTADDGNLDEDVGAVVQKSVEELYEQLQMDEDLITAALQFWVGKGVLRRIGGANSSTYAVAETLDEEPDPTVTAATTIEPSAADDQPMEEEPAVATVGTNQSMSAKERERREIYWRYIQGMLTNASASMPLAQMAMMMKMLISDGFPWSNEELQDFLGEKVAEGLMEVVGGKYRLVKK
ncbi:hypothetical protein C7999DRAFT_37764 [Corynascus novoguineensis]|uniref:Anaphase-promoting complex subunit 2 n=1 Tax=Corynascus novoguineensis TaxID=1126955 RepID=A0AAN7HN59_9PEZI|nr:hypothetical protein C7999DRAFT_37764 [Corynascus novoguineensis]